MIKIEKNKDNVKTYMKDLFWAFCKIIFIIDIISFIYTCLFLIIGFLFSYKESIRSGFELLALTVMLAIIEVMIFFNINKNLKLLFKNSNIVEFLISKEDDDFIIENVTNKTQIRIKCKDIKKIKLTKKIIIIKTELNGTIWFPMNDELVDLLRKRNLNYNK